MPSVFIFLSSLLVLISPIVYARAILHGDAKPHRTTRLVLLVIAVLSTASLFANNDTVAVWLAGVTTVQAVIVFVLSIKYGMGGWAKLDLLCLAIALAGIVAWRMTDNPLLGLYFSILADFTGVIPTIIKTYRLPKTEIATFFILDSCAAIFTLLALRTHGINDVAYPLYILAVNILMTTLIVWPRHHFPDPQTLAP